VHANVDLRASQEWAAVKYAWQRAIVCDLTLAINSREHGMPVPLSLCLSSFDLFPRSFAENCTIILFESTLVML
jgi:hypothetical protein